jgi:protein regulator of cytokinesis 1
MDWLYDELDILPPSCEDPSTSASSSLQASTTSTPSDDPFLSSSISTPTPASRAPTRRNLTDLKPVAQSPNIEYARIFALFTIRISEAEEAGNTVEPGSLVGVEGVEPSVGLIRWAEQSKAELEDIKRRRETHIQTMYDQLENLWKRLGVPEEAMDGFVENNRGSSEEVVQAYEQELERMLELKRESMGVFIANARAEIEKLWDELMVGEEERSDFTYFTEGAHISVIKVVILGLNHGSLQRTTARSSLRFTKRRSGSSKRNVNSKHPY